jgi:hypothetical protein
MSRVAWYRFRTTFRSRRGGYLALILLIGLVGGLAMGAVAGARRTQSSYPTFFASTNPSDFIFLSAVFNPASGGTTGYDPTVLAQIARLPHVKGVESQGSLQELQLGADGAPISTSGTAVDYLDGAIDGEYFTQDRVTVVAGRMANPADPDEAVLNAADAGVGGIGIGSVIPIGIYTNAQTLLPNFGTAGVPPIARATIKVVGFVRFDDQIVGDDVDLGTTPIIFTPALLRPYLDCCVGDTQTGVQVDGGSRNVAVVEAELTRLLPGGQGSPFVATAPAVAKAERAIKPESIALGVFGGIAALAALLIAGQLVGRQVRLGADEVTVLRALGAGPAITMADPLVGVLGAVVTGSVLAALVAVALSPLAPIGPVSAIYPTPGIAVDWAVLGVGVAVLVAVLSALAVVASGRVAPQRAHRRPVDETGSSVARAAASAGLPPSAVAGIRFALEPGSGRSAVPVRSALLGAALAVIVTVATVTFGASLHTLVSHPPLYGWNWSYEISAGSGDSVLPQQELPALLGADRDVAAWSGFYFSDLDIDGQYVPVLGGTANAPVGPPVLSGHGFDGSGQLVLGATTLAQLHKRLGDTVTVSAGPGSPDTTLRIVGTATMPALGAGGEGEHLEMGSGALLSYQLIPLSAQNLFNNPLPGPNAVFVRLRNGVNPRAAEKELSSIAMALSDPGNGGAGVSAVERPAEIINYRSMGTTPDLLGAGLAAGAVAALELTLVSSVRRRRRDLALLKALGFTGRQLAGIVAWQSTVSVGIGTLAGVPLGIVAGRALWDLFAREIHAVPQPTVPAVPILLIAVGGLVLANIVAAIPGRIAARTPTALILRAG